MKWLDTSTTADASASAAAFWEKHRADLLGEQFWADRIAKYRDQPVERLQLSIQNLPLPAAFREAAVAIRALIRSRVQEKQDFIDELVLLYWLAAVESFGIPYSEHLRQPGFNVLQRVPGHVIKSLPFTYKALGYKYLTLLNKTDIKSRDRGLSAMPEEFRQVLTKRELRDLIEFLGGLKQP